MTAATGWMAWLREHPRETTIAGGGVVVALMVIGFLFGKGEIRVDPVAGGAFSDALNLVDRQVGAAMGDEPTFETEEAKREALAAAFAKVRDEHGGKPAGLSATLALADVHFQAGRYLEALALYDEFLAKADSGNAMRGFALQGRALALEGTDDLEGALQAFEALEADGLEGQALYGKARVFERQSKWEDARAIWETLKEEHAMSAVGREASSRLGRLNLLHPQVAAEKEG